MWSSVCPGSSKQQRTRTVMASRHDSTDDVEDELVDVVHHRRRHAEHDDVNVTVRANLGGGQLLLRPLRPKGGGHPLLNRPEIYRQQAKQQLYSSI